MRGEKFRAILESGNEDLFKELLHSKITKSGVIPKSYMEPKYRIYINDNLITERDWVWKNNIKR
jgi:hypothetical protein